MEENISYDYFYSHLLLLIHNKNHNIFSVLIKMKTKKESIKSY